MVAFLLSEAAGFVTITSGSGQIALSAVPIATVAPGLFTANANGQGVAAAVVLRIKADGSQSYEPVSRFDAAANQSVSVPIDLGATTDLVFLLAYGSGIRGRSALTAISATIGGTAVPVEYAGPQGDFAGLDQLNVLLPRSLAGRGEVDLTLTVDGKTANTVRVSIK